MEVALVHVRPVRHSWLGNGSTVITVNENNSNCQFTFAGYICGNFDSYCFSSEPSFRILFRDLLVSRFKGCFAIDSPLFEASFTQISDPNVLNQFRAATFAAEVRRLHRFMMKEFVGIKFSKQDQDSKFWWFPFFWNAELSRALSPKEILEYLEAYKSERLSILHSLREYFSNIDPRDSVVFFEEMNNLFRDDVVVWKGLPRRVDGITSTEQLSLDLLSECLCVSFGSGSTSVIHPQFSKDLMLPGQCLVTGIKADVVEYMCCVESLDQSLQNLNMFASFAKNNEFHFCSAGFFRNLNVQKAGKLALQRKHRSFLHQRFRFKGNKFCRKLLIPLNSSGSSVIPELHNFPQIIPKCAQILSSKHLDYTNPFLPNGNQLFVGYKVLSLVAATVMFRNNPLSTAEFLSVTRSVFRNPAFTSLLWQVTGLRTLLNDPDYSSDLQVEIGISLIGSVYVIDGFDACFKLFYAAVDLFKKVGNIPNSERGLNYMGKFRKFLYDFENAQKPPLLPSVTVLEPILREPFVKLSNLEDALGIEFVNKKLLLKALISEDFHEIYKPKLGHNDSLEFLGDSILDLVMSEIILLLLPGASAQELNEVRLDMVSNETLIEISHHWKLSNYVLILDAHSGKKTLADAMESIIGAIHIDQGIIATTMFLLRVFAPQFAKYLCNEQLKNPRYFFSHAVKRLFAHRTLSMDIKYDFSQDGSTKLCTISLQEYGSQPMEISQGAGWSEVDAANVAAWAAVATLLHRYKRYLL